jgi:hypothetical protein
MDFRIFKATRSGRYGYGCSETMLAFRSRAWKHVPIPVDIHITRATLCGGAIRGRYIGSIATLQRKVRNIWQQAMAGLYIDGRTVSPLDIDRELWTLSKYGCSTRGNNSNLSPCPPGCPLFPGCVEGHITFIKKRRLCDFETHGFYDEQIVS